VHKGNNEEGRLLLPVFGRAGVSRTHTAAAAGSHEGSLCCPASSQPLEYGGGGGGGEGYESSQLGCVPKQGKH
jgi:hypothetical protein